MLESGSMNSLGRGNVDDGTGGVLERERDACSIGRASLSGKGMPSSSKVVKCINEPVQNFIILILISLCYSLLASILNAGCIGRARIVPYAESCDICNAFLLLKLSSS